MRIAFLDLLRQDYSIETPRRGPLGGSQSSLCYLAEELAKLGHAVTLLNNTSVAGRFRGVECLRFDQVPAANYAAYDAIIVLNVGLPSVPRVIRAAGGSPPPVVLWSQHNHDQPAVSDLAERSAQESWDHFVLVSGWQAKGYRDVFGIDADRIEIIGNAIGPAFENLFPDPEEAAARKPWPPVLCYTSTPFRGLDVLLKAFPRIRQALPGTRLRVFSSMSVYGVKPDDDPYGALYDLCRSTEGVEYVGSVSQDVLARELRDATCLAYPNTFAEGYCISVLEAMAAGCVVITSDLGALRDTTAGFGHLLVPHPDKEVHASLYAEFAVRVLKDFHASSEARNRLAAQVREVNRTGTWTVRARQWDGWLRSMLETGWTRAREPSLVTAAAHYHAGRLQEAETLCGEFLRRRPGHAKALYLLGMIELQRAQPARAVEFLRQAARQSPSSAAMHSDLGSAAKAAGDLELARASYRRAVELAPALAEAHNNLGVVLRESGDAKAAEACYGRALQIDPGFAAAHFNLGNLLASQGRLLEAADALRRAAESKPEYAHALARLGKALMRQGDPLSALAAARDATRFDRGSAPLRLRLANLCAAADKPDEAEASYRRALELQPDLAEASLRLAQLLRSLGRLADAAPVLEQGAAACPDHADILFQLGNAWRDLGSAERAIPRYQRVLELQPDHFAAANNLGAILLGLWNLDQAIAVLEAAARLRPEAPEVHGNLGTAYLYRGQLRESIDSYRRALALAPDLTAAHSNLLLVLNYDETIDPATLFAEHRRWAERYEAPISGARRGPTGAIAPAAAQRRLRIGYVSPDFHDHPVARFFEPILESHDRERFAVYCYSLIAARDPTTARLEALSQGWRETAGMSDAQIAERIRADAIDVLVDLAGHTRNNRLLVFAHRPAPVQVAFLGYPNTTGLGSIDYVITDGVLDPPEHPTLYTEQPIRLPFGFCPFRPSPGAPAVAPLPALAAGALTFGSVHNFAKLNPAVLDLWCQVLRALPSARLLIYRHTLNPSMQARVHGLFAERGIAAERVLLRQAVDVAQGFFGGYATMDVLLDSFPFCGHTTTCEALWMGVPVLTLYGDRRAGRMSASVLSQLDLADWIARSPGEYVERAVRAAAEIPQLARLREGMRERMLASKLCDCRAYTRTLEAAYRDAWRAWCRKAA